MKVKLQLFDILRMSHRIMGDYHEKYSPMISINRLFAILQRFTSVFLIICLICLYYYSLIFNEWSAALLRGMPPQFALLF